MRCSCGGAVELLDASESSGPLQFRERYQCAECGRHGELQFENGSETVRGCLVLEGA